MNESIVYLNGEFLPLEEAKIPVLDRGFIFGDGVYEVIPCYGGRLFRLEEHLRRLQHSLDGIRLRNPLTPAEWKEMLQRLAEANPEEDQSLYLQVTRGVAGRDHRFPEKSTPTVFAMSKPLPPAPPELLERGVAAITLPDIRWQCCHIKAISLLPNVLLRQQALEAGADEAILVRDGEATEGAASNLFIVEAGVLITPPKDHRLLPGITRDLVVELARNAGIPCRERTVTESELRAAQEIWITSSTREILPVTRLDDTVVGKGRPGEMWQRMYQLYQQYKERLRTGEAETDRR